MTLPDVLFYFFSFLLLLGGVSVVSSRNPVYAVLSLIFAFFNAAALFILLGAEYLAMTLVIVYVGAVAILFLFVVMMLDINFAALKKGFARHLPLGIVMAVALFLVTYALIEAGFRVDAPRLAAPYPIPAADSITNAHAIGRLLYTDFIYPFQISGLILLVAMIGAIVLTLRHRRDVRRQDINKQLARTRKDAVRLVDVEVGKGV
jgi:NADH-quinone oxidoreductase subunit J